MQDLVARKFKPIYFLMGDESYYIDKICDYISDHVLSEAERDFNQTVLYGRDIDAGLIDNAARRFPMMSEYQVILVKEAQEIKKLDDLVYYATKPSVKTILVICYKYGTYDKRKKFFKAVEASGVIFESKKLYDNQVPAWITQYLKDRNYQIDVVTATLLTDFLGSDLSKVANELDKLCIMLPVGTRITPDHIEKNIGISKDYNNFELQKAVGLKDVLKANRIVDYFGKNQKDNPIVVTINSLFSYFNKILTYHFLKDKSAATVASSLQINPYFVKDYEATAKRYDTRKTVQVISLLREFDAKSKGVGNVSADSGDLLKELVFKIMH